MVADRIDDRNAKPTPAVRSKIFNLYWRLRKVKNKIAIIVVIFAIIGNLASIPAHVEAIRIFLIKRFAIEDYVFWHVFFAALLAIGLLGSYLFLAFWLYNRNIAAKPERIRRFYGILFFVGAVALSAVNIYFVIPRVPPISPIVKNIEGDMKKALLQQQVNQPPVKQGGETGDDDSGGFQFAQNGGSHGTQVWTTAQVLYALEMAKPVGSEAREAIRLGFGYIERMRITAVSSPCQQANDQQDGWGYQKSLPWGVTEINSWVLLAKIASLRTTLLPAIWSEPEIPAKLEDIKSDLGALARRQHSNGGWAPIAKTVDDNHLRTYSTVMALWALIEAKHSIVLNPIIGHEYDQAITDGAQWLIDHWQPPDDRGRGGWWPNPSWREKDTLFPGLTAQVVYVLELVKKYYRLPPDEEQFKKAKVNFIQIATGEIDPGNSLGARDVSENQRAHDSDRYLENEPYTVEQSTFLWYPWAIAALTELKTDNSIKEDKQAVAELWKSTLRRVSGYEKFTERDPVIYPKAEGLLALEISNSGEP